MNGRIPTSLRALRTWLLWRYEAGDAGNGKPRKVPYYANGSRRSGQQRDDEPYVTWAEAVAAQARGRYDGIGLAMREANGIVALDFDNCIGGVGGAIDAEVERLCEGTYSEVSPSGVGVRAFFKGRLADRKDKSGSPRVEVFCAAGYVTVTGRMTDACDMWGWDEIAPLSAAVLEMHRKRFGGGAGGGDDSLDWLANVTPKLGVSTDDAKAMLDALSADCGYDEWLKAGQALHHEFDGSQDAFGLWLEWSRSSDKFPGERALQGHWRSFGRPRGTPVTMRSLKWQVKQAVVDTRYEAVASWREKVVEADERELREVLCPAIKADAGLDTMDRETLCSVVQTRLRAVGLSLPLPVVRKMLTPANVPTVRTDRPLTEFGMVDRMLARFGDELMYVPETARWYRWSGVYWRNMTVPEVEHFAKETVRALKSESDVHGGDASFFEFCAYAQSARMVRNMVGLASSDPRVMVPVSEVDKHARMLVVTNGVVDLRSGRLHEPDPVWRSTKACACAYDPSAKSDLWESTVLDVFSGDAEMAAFFRRLMGYTLLGDPVEDILVVAFGTGSNGKSTVFGAIRRVLGGYAKSADPATFVADGFASSAGGPREDLLRLKGSRFVYCNEPDEGGELREGTVKAMSGGDAIAARGINAKDTVEIEPTWVVVMPTNHKPIVKGSDNGIWRRLLLLPFVRQFRDGEKDTNREARLAAEQAGILRWLIDGALEYSRVGLRIPASVANAGAAYRSDMDLLSTWIEDRCELDPAFSEESQALWQSWQSFAQAGNLLHYIRSSVSLGRRLDQRFPAVKGPGGRRMRVGIRLRRLETDFFDT